jgi:predicted RNA binding protein YcfA (HicA-like mRNA interferase family)
MKLPRDLAGARLIRHLCGNWGYRRVHQVGSHVTLETGEPCRHRIVVPEHSALRVGTLAAIRSGVAQHKAVTRDDLLDGLR